MPIIIYIGWFALAAVASVLNLSSPFTAASSEVADISGSGIVSTLNSGREIALDGISEKIVIGDISGFGGATRVLRIELTAKAAAAVTVWVQSSDSAGYSASIAVEDAGIYKDLSISLSNLAIASATNVEIGHSANDTAYTAASFGEYTIIGDNGDATAEVVIAHGYCNISSDATAAGLDGYTIPDASGNGYHGVLSGGDGATGIGAYPYVTDRDDRFWFPLTTYATLGTAITDSNTTITFKIIIDDAIPSETFLLFKGDINTKYLFIAENGSGFAPWSGDLVGLVMTIDGVSVTTRNEVWDAIADGVEHTVVITGLDFSIWTAFGLNTYQSTFKFSGAVTEMQIDLGSTGTTDYEYVFDGTTASAWTTKGSNDFTLTGTGATVADRRNTVSQIAGMNWNRYQVFNSGNSQVTYDTGSTALTYLASKTITCTWVAFDFDGIGVLHSHGNSQGRLYHNTSGDLFIQASTDTGFNLELGVEYTTELEMDANGDAISLTINGVEEWTGTVTGDTASRSTFSVGANQLAIPNFWFGGLISNFSITSTVAWAGYGANPWDDTINSNDGTEVGTFADYLCPESDASSTVDAYGNTIDAARTNTNVLNLVGDGDSLYVPANDLLDATKTVVEWIWHDGTAKTVVDLGTPTVGTTTTDLTSSGFTGVVYFVNGASGTTLATGWNHCVVVSTAALSTDAISITKKSANTIFDAEEWSVLDALSHYNSTKGTFGL